MVNVPPVAPVKLNRYSANLVLDYNSNFLIAINLLKDWTELFS